MIVFPSLTREQATELYAHLGTVRAVADLLGCSHWPVYAWLGRLGVRLQKRGGAWQRDGHRLESGQAVKAKGCKRVPCVQGRTWRGAVIVCAFTGQAGCGECRRGYAMAVEDVVSRPASSMAEAREVGIESAAAGTTMVVRRGR